MIKPAHLRAEEYVKAGVTATSGLDMARSIRAILEQERTLLAREVWSPRVSAEGYFDMRSQHARLCDTMEIIDQIIGHMEGTPPPVRRLPHLRRPEKAYGER